MDRATVFLLLAGSAFGVVALAPPAAAGSELLSNAGFETGDFSHWNTVMGSCPGTGTIQIRSDGWVGGGAYSARIHKTNNVDPCAITQNVAATAGETYVAGATFYVLSGNGAVYLDFLDWRSERIDYTVTSTSGHGEQVVRVAMVAPPGTVRAMVWLYMDRGVTGEFYVDEAHLCAPPSCPGSPGAPTAVAVAAGDRPGEIDVTWQPPISDGGAPITSYVVYWGTSSGSQPNREPVASTSWTHGGLTAETTYYYRVAATNDYGESVASAVVAARPGEFPAAPSGASATPGEEVGEVRVSWTAPSAGSAPIEAYHIYRRFEPDGGLGAVDPGAWNQVGATAGETSFVDRDVTLGAYAYVVTAVNVVGEGPASGPARAVGTKPIGMIVSVGTSEPVEDDVRSGSVSSPPVGSVPLTVPGAEAPATCTADVCSSPTDVGPFPVHVPGVDAIPVTTPPVPIHTGCLGAVCGPSFTIPGQRLGATPPVAGADEETPGVVVPAVCAVLPQSCLEATPLSPIPVANTPPVTPVEVVPESEAHGRWTGASARADPRWGEQTTVNPVRVPVPVFGGELFSVCAAEPCRAPVGPTAAASTGLEARARIGGTSVGTP